MQRSDWAGVFPAITTPFADDLSVDHEALAAHVRWLAERGCRGIVALGSLGEGATLTAGEKAAVLRTCRAALDGVPLVAGIGGLATADCVALARTAREVGCDGLMVLPPYAYQGDRRETRAHLGAVIEATPLSCMLYNNPLAYGTDVSPAELVEFASHPNLHAVKESSGDVRRLAGIRELLGDRFALFVGVDDLIVEGIAMGAVGWIAGLVNALPDESVRLFDLSMAGKHEAAWELYRWFLPLLRLDVGPHFVQYIKLVQEMVGRGRATVRPPRLPLVGEQLAVARALIAERLASRR